MPPTPSARASQGAPTDWHAQELLLMREVMRLIGRSLAPGLVLREMLHLMSELLGLNRGRIVLVDDAPSSPAGAPRTASIQHAYGLTQAEVQRGRYAWGEGITGRVLATGQPAIVQDIDAEPLFLARAVARSQLPPETVAFIALPIEVNNAPIGVLACHRIRSRQRHLNDDLAVLRVLATLVGQLLQLEALVAEQTRQLEARNAVLANALNTKSARYGLIGSSPPLLQALSELERVSQTQATVLLLGQSGTGKELFARAVHLASGRRDRPFIKVNCSAIRALALHFVSRANQAHQRNVNLSPDALARLEEHPWPGNIRELGNVIERLVLLTNDTLVARAELDRFLPAVSAPQPSPPAPQPPDTTGAAAQPAAAPAPLVRDYAPAQSHSVLVLQAALAGHHGNQSRAAQSLGLTLRQFSYRLRKAGLK